ncbi:MAG TPA: hypothetical protein VHT52_14185 [Stellaceae bacterium]|jgi:hypothetical protein|nr:hypothetical protein [Stellaceae bacterium]
MIETKDLKWQGDELYYAHRKLNVCVVPDETYPGVMWRVRRPDGTVTDMVSRTRARDAALFIAVSMLNDALR